MDIAAYMRQLGEAARSASRETARADAAAKNLALTTIAAAILREKDALLAANRADLEAARATGMETAMLDRLALNEKSIATMAEGLRQIADLPDPVGEITDLKYRPTGIQVGRMRVPLGVVGIISLRRWRCP